MLDSKGAIWVTDFGLAKLFDEDSTVSQTGELVGTPRYMAPEQMLGVVDTRCDIYGIGVTLYEIAAGRGPWDGRTEQPRSGRVLEMADVRDVNPEIPVELAQIIMKACAHHPESRFQTPRELEFALNEFAYRGQTDRRSHKRQTRRTAALSLTAVGVLGCALLANGNFAGLFGGKSELPSNSGLPPGFTWDSQQETDEFDRPRANCITYQDPATGLMHVVTKVSARADDAEQYGEGVMYVDSTDLELVWDDCNQTIGVRFDGVRIPRDAGVQYAEIAFCSAGARDDDCRLSIHGIAEPQMASFRLTAFDLTNRVPTEASVEWVPEAWEPGKIYRSTDCRTIVQELISQEDWKSGDALGFRIQGKGCRRAEAYDGSVHRAPTLTIHYTATADRE